MAKKKKKIVKQTNKEKGNEKIAIQLFKIATKLIFLIENDITQNALEAIKEGDKLARTKVTIKKINLKEKK